MPFHLTVSHAFENRRVSEEITDATEIDRILSSRFEHHVVKRWVAEELVVEDLAPAGVSVATAAPSAPAVVAAPPIKAAPTSEPFDPTAISVGR